MIALKLPEIKYFMNQLLCTDTFDHFLLQEAIIQRDITWNIDGRLNHQFYDAEDPVLPSLAGLSFLPFANVRTRCFDLIRGKQTPTYFKFVLLLSPANMLRTIEQAHTSFTAGDVSAMYVNLVFIKGVLQLTTGISYRIFSSDKSLEHEWDRMIQLFLKNHEILFLEEGL